MLFLLLGRESYMIRSERVRRKTNLWMRLLKHVNLIVLYLAHCRDLCHPAMYLTEIERRIYIRKPRLSSRVSFKSSSLIKRSEEIRSRELIAFYEKYFFAVNTLLHAQASRHNACATSMH